MGWFKVWDREWLDNTDDMSLELQGACIRIMSLANTIIDDGRFSYEKTIPLTQEQILAGVNIPETLWNEAIQAKFVIKKDGFFEVKNFKKYQNEYQRQKGYRKRLQRKVTPIFGSEDFSLKPLALSLKPTETSKDTPTSKPTPSASPQSAFVDWFKIEFQNRFGKPYVDSKPDYIQISQVIKSYQGDIELLKRLVQRAWNTPDEKNFSISSVCMTVKGFCSVVNRIQLQKPKPKTAYQIEQEQKDGKIL